MRLDVAVEVVAHKVVIAVLGDGVAQGREAVGVTKHAATNGFEHFGEVGIELKLAKSVGVAEVLDVFGEVAKEEDVGFADLARNLDLDI